MSKGGEMNPEADARLRSPVRVLVMHEDDVIRSSYGHALRQRGCVVETAPNSQVALGLLSSREFDVFVTDLQSADDRSVALLERTLRLRPWLGVVILSSGMDRATLDQVYDLGCSCILERPVKLTALCDSVLNEAQARKQLAHAPTPAYAEDLPPGIAAMVGETHHEVEAIRFRFIVVGHEVAK
jgi:DNA-binding NtrC family response regulator